MTQTNPADVFRELIIAFLTPIFLSATGGDIAYARAAAAHTVAGYGVRDPSDLLAIAQVIALGLAALSSISLSMADSLPIPLILRLRGNATNLHRASERCRQVVRADPAAMSEPQTAPAGVAPDQVEAVPVEAVPVEAEQPAAEPPIRTAPEAARPASPAQDDSSRHAWASAMTNAASACTAGLAALPPAERRHASLRAAVLSSVARDLLSAKPATLAPFKLGKP